MPILNGNLQTPRELAAKHPEIFVISLVLFIFGVAIGFQPEISEQIIRQAQETTINPYAMTDNFWMILSNNGLISSIAWIGWFVFPFFGLSYFPPTIMVYSVGATFGAVTSAVTPLRSLITLSSFGVLEASALLLGISAGLLFPEYVFLKVMRKQVNFQELLVDSGTLFLYSGLFLVIAAFFETLLLNPSTTWIAVIVGSAATVSLLWFFFIKNNNP